MLHPTTGALSDLQIERARALDQLDDILNTAAQAQRALTPDEQADHDYLVRRADDLERQLARTSPRTVPVNPIVRSYGDDRVAARSLDELLWASPETVAAGTLTRGGKWLSDPGGARNEVERSVVAYDGSTPILAPRLTDFAPEHQNAVRAFQQTVADMQFFGILVDRSATTGAEGFEVARRHPAMAGRWQQVCRAMDVDTSAEGGTWVPTGIGAAVHEKVRAMGKVAPLFQRIPLPSNPWKWPIEGADAVAYRIGEPTGDTESKMTASTPGTIGATFDAEIFGARSLISRSLDADSAVAVIPFVQAKLARAFSIAEERAILDGDTDGTHQDSDVGASTSDARTAWDGLRKRALAETTQATTTTTAANLALIRKSMGKWGVDPAELAIIVGVQSYYALMSDTNLITVDKFGPNATILAGQVGALYGAPVIVSEYVRDDLNASGVYDGITTTKTYNMVVNRSEFALGQRMNLEIETDDSVYRETYQRLVVGFSRLDFQAIAAASTDDVVSVGYNVTSGS